MAKFCTQCGKPLGEGEVCSCQAVPQMTPPPVAPQQAAPQMTPPPAASQQAAPQMTPPPAASQQAAPQMTPPPVAPQQVAPQMTPPPAASQQAAPQMTPPPVAPQQAAPQQAAPPQMTPPPVAPPLTQYQTSQIIPPPTAPQQVPPPTAQNGQAPAMTKEAEWFNEKKDMFVSSTKNVFQELLPMLKTPTDAVARIAKGDSGLVLGLELMAVKTFLALVMFLITFIRLNHLTGGYVDLPWFRGILLVLFVTIGADCLNAVILKFVSGLFNAQMSMKAGFAITGHRVLFDVMVMVVIGIVSLLSTGIAVAIVAVAALCLVVIEYNSYAAVVELDNNKKAYVYILIKAVVTFIMLLIAYLFVKGMVSGLIGSLLGNAMGGLGGGSLFDALY